MFARPLKQFIERRSALGILAGFVIFAADEQDIVAIGARAEADVVVGIAVVPIERVGDGVGRHHYADHVGAIGGLLEVDAHPVVDGRRRVGGNDNRIGDDGVGAGVDHRASSFLRFRIGALHVVDSAAGV